MGNHKYALHISICYSAMVISGTMLLPLKFFTIIVLLATTLDPVGPGVAQQLYEWQQGYHVSSLNDGQVIKRTVEKRQIIAGGKS